jgi:lysophospholipase L1-like esterase
LTSRRILGKATLLLAAIGLSLVFAELAFRVMDPQVMQVPLFTHVHGVTVNRAVVRGRSYAPGDFDTTITTNSLGLRGSREFSTTPENHTLRILTLGDSLTWGTGAEDRDAYPAQLERILQRSTGSLGRSVEVLNAGVAGTGTGEQALYFAGRLAGLKPHLVILGVYYNDVYDDRRGFFRLAQGEAVPSSVSSLESKWKSAEHVQRALRLIPAYSYLTEHSQLVNLLRSSLSRALAPGDGAAMASDSSPAAEIGDVLSGGLPLMGQEIEWLDRRVRESDGRLIVVWMPSRGVVLDEGTEEAHGERLLWHRFEEFLAEACRAKNIPFADLTPLMWARSRSGAALYYRKDSHPTPGGYGVIAEGVAAALVDLVPSVP